jgi:hypothetical protein
VHAGGRSVENFGHSLVRAYNILMARWSKGMGSRTTPDAPDMAPGSELSPDQLKEAEAYFKHHEGVYVTKADWDEEDLTDVVADSGQ